MQSDIKIGLFGARIDNGGLGIQTLDLFNHILFHKTLAIDITHQTGYTSFPERYQGQNITIVKYPPTAGDINHFFKGLNLVFLCEDCYCRHFYDYARERSIKTILQLNYEWLKEIFTPDFYLSPSTWNFDKIPSPKVVLPFPVNRETYPFRLRKRANIFLHIGGHTAAAFERNGTQRFFDAIPFVKSDVQFIVYSQDYLDNVPNDKRLDYRFGDFPISKHLYEEADVLVYPRKYGGQSLQLNEALSSGLAIMMPDMDPQNKFLPSQPLFSVDNFQQTALNPSLPSFTTGNISPVEIANKIDEFAFSNIESYSHRSNEIAEGMSWTTLLPQYHKLFTQVFNGAY